MSAHGREPAAATPRRNSPTPICSHLPPFYVAENAVRIIPLSQQRPSMEKMLEGAERKRDELVQKAAELLRELAVEPSDVLSVVEACIVRNANVKRK